MNPSIEFFGGPLDGEVRTVQELLPLFTVEIRVPVPFAGAAGQPPPAAPAPRLHFYRPASVWKDMPFPYRWAGDQ